MTIKNLIDQLQKCEPDREVYISVNLAEFSESIETPRDVHQESFIKGYEAALGDVEAVYDIGIAKAEELLGNEVKGLHEVHLTLQDCVRA